MKLNDIILAKISGVSYVVGAIVVSEMPLLQKAALCVAILSGTLSIGDKLWNIYKSRKRTK